MLGSMHNTKPMRVTHIGGAQLIIKKITQHEVGHYIIARVYGFKTGELSLELTDYTGAHNGGAVIELGQTLHNIEDIQNYLEKRIIILFSGVLAENLEHEIIDEDKANTSLTEGGVNDYAKIRELIHLLRNIKYPKSVSDEERQKELDEIWKSLWQSAKELILKESKLIVGVASRFASDIEFTNTKYTLTESDLKLIPNLSKRFNK